MTDLPALRTGCDLVDIARLGAALERRSGLLRRVFTDREIDEAQRDDVAIDGEVAVARLAARFAAKEAARKALGDLRLPFHAVEVRSRPDGAPELWLHGAPSGLACSLSHDGGIAMAVVVGLVPAPASSTPTSATATDTDPVPSPV